jgi:hypothetical protein
MEINKLDAATVKNAKPKDKEYSLGDGTGLYLLVRPSGGKLWRWSYEFNRKEKLMSYGPYPAVSLAQARVLHEAARAVKRQGIDPAVAKAETKHNEQTLAKESSAPTFATLTAEWLKTWTKWKSLRYVETVNTRLERDILPAVGNVPIDQLDKRVLTKIVSDIQDDRDAEELARRALQKMKQIFRFAVAKDYSKINRSARLCLQTFFAHTLSRTLPGSRRKTCPNSSRKSRSIRVRRSLGSR